MKKLVLLILKTLGIRAPLLYINGPETLPPPLSKDREEEVFKRLEKDDVDARNTLIVHNLRLVVYIAKKFETTGINLEDLISIGTIGLIKAVNTFKPSKNIKLATYASRCIENEILMFLRKASNKHHDISIDEPLNIDWDGNELLLSDIMGTDANEVSKDIEKETEHDQLISMVKRLEPREQQIISLRFGLLGSKEHTQKEVADIMGISQSYISRLEKKVIQQLKVAIEKEFQ